MGYDYYGMNWDYGLSHHGVKGQKWGVRKRLKRAVSAVINRGGKLVKVAKGARQRRKEAREAKKESSNPESLISKDHAAGHSKKPIEQMTNSELQAMVTRLTLENNYRNQKNIQEAAAKGKSSVDKAIDALSKAGRAAETIDKLATSSEKIYKRFSARSSNTSGKK